MAEHEAKLELVEWVEEYDLPKMIPLPRESTVTLGRSSKMCTVVLDATPTKSISRKHAEIVFGKQKGAPDTYTLRDLGSTNGVFVNDFKVEEHRLKHGDVVQFGGAADIPVGTRFGGSGNHIRYRFYHEPAARSAQASRKRRLSAEPSADVPEAQRPRVERTNTLDAAGTLRAISNGSTKKTKSGSVGVRDEGAGVGAVEGSSARETSGGARETPSAVVEVLRDAMCGLCSELLLDAGVLPCSHSFCRLCWADHVEKKGTTCPICLRKMHSSERNPRHCSNLDLLITSIVHKLASPEERERWRLRQEHAEKRKTEAATAAAAAATAAAAAPRQVGAGHSSGSGGGGSGPVAEARRAVPAAAAPSVGPAVTRGLSSARDVEFAQNGVRLRRGEVPTNGVPGRRDTGPLSRRSGSGRGGGDARGRGVATGGAATREGDREGGKEMKCEGCNEEGHEFRQCPHRSDSALEGSESEDEDESEEEEEEEEEEGDEDYEGSDDA